LPNQLSKSLHIIIKNQEPLYISGSLEKRVDGTFLMIAKNIALVEDIAREMDNNGDNQDKP
jgi:hypothetical protein